MGFAPESMFMRCCGDGESSFFEAGPLCLVGKGGENTGLFVCRGEKVWWGMRICVQKKKFVGGCVQKKVPPLGREFKGC